MCRKYYMKVEKLRKNFRMKREMELDSSHPTHWQRFNKYLMRKVIKICNDGFQEDFLLNLIYYIFSLKNPLRVNNKPISIMVNKCKNKLETFIHDGIPNYQDG